MATVTRLLAAPALLPLLLLLPACSDETTTDPPDRPGRSEQSASDGAPAPQEEAFTVPGIPDAATAREQLGELPDAPEGDMAGYERELFPHWSEDGECSTRETVLARDGTDVVPGEDCYPESGSWYSQYDGATLDEAPDVDIDHVVPLAEAWRSGADAWTTDRREAFANDLEHPQLIAVSASSNRSKGDQDPADWEPPAASFHCVYARMWIGAKHAWELSVDPDERTALEELLGTC